MVQCYELPPFQSFASCWGLRTVHSYFRGVTSFAHTLLLRSDLHLPEMLYSHIVYSRHLIPQFPGDQRNLLLTVCLEQLREMTRSWRSFSAELMSVMLSHPVFNVPANAPRARRQADEGRIHLGSVFLIYLMATGCHCYSAREDRLRSNQDRNSSLEIQLCSCCDRQREQETASSGTSAPAESRYCSISVHKAWPPESVKARNSH